jgi:hypothetical protein
MLANLEKSQGGQPKKNSRHDVGSTSPYREAIEEAEIDERAAQRWQQVAAVPEEQFAEYLEEREEISTSGLFDHANRGQSGNSRPIAATCGLRVGHWSGP